MPKTRTLNDRDAFIQWLQMYKMSSYTLADKYAGDHTLEHLSSSKASEKALERFVKNRNTRSTWMDTPGESIINKVKGAVDNAFYQATKSGVPENVFKNLRPCVHKGGQQLAALIKASVRTVTISELTRDEAMHGPNKNRHHERKLDGNTYYLLCQSTEEVAQFWIVGEWKPLSCAFNLYHFQASPTPEIGILPKYLKWDTAGDNTTITSPHATK